MVLTRKFSQFPTGTLDQAVGLEAGANTKGPGGGGGGSGSVTQTFPQTIPPAVKGQWLRVQLISGVYTPAQGDTAEDGEVIGIVIEANAATFTLQQSGYITSAQAVVAGLTPGEVQFLDTATAGTMVPIDATVDGEVSRPVFVPDSPTSGWVLPYRPALVGGAFVTTTGGGGDETSIVTVNQVAHGFIPGDVVRVSTPSVGGPISYTLAQGDTFANSKAVGVVVANPPPTPNQFTLQFSGYNVGSITVDDQFIPQPVVASTTYYLSAFNAGKVTDVDPSLFGFVSKPIYQTEQGSANLGINAGYILPQRPLAGPGNPSSGNVFLGYLNDANNYDSTDPVFGFPFGGFNSYFIILIASLSPAGTGGVGAGGGGAATVGFQAFSNGVWFTGAQSHYTLGVNSTANPVTTGVIWSSVVNDASDTSLVVLPAIANEVFITDFKGYFNIITGLSTGIGLQHQSIITDTSTTPPIPIGYTSNGWAGADTGGFPIDGIRLFFGGGAAIFPGQTSYFAVYGIPNT